VIYGGRSQKVRGLAGCGEWEGDAEVVGSASHLSAGFVCVPVGCNSSR
jgi:hypothetical protein